MLVEFNVNCLGYGVGGYNRKFEIEIEESELEGMTEDEKRDYIHKCCWEYTTGELEIEIGFEEK